MTNIEILKEDILGSTIKLQGTHKDAEGNLIDPDSQSVKIYDPDGALKTTIESPTPVSEGVYYVEYDTPIDAEAGVWKCVWSHEKATKKKVQDYRFSMKAP